MKAMAKPSRSEFMRSRGPSWVTETQFESFSVPVSLACCVDSPADSHRDVVRRRLRIERPPAVVLSVFAHGVKQIALRLGLVDQRLSREGIGGNPFEETRRKLAELPRKPAVGNSIAFQHDRQLRQLEPRGVAVYGLSPRIAGNTQHHHQGRADRLRQLLLVDFPPPFSTWRSIRDSEFSVIPSTAGRRRHMLAGAPQESSVSWRHSAGRTGDWPSSAGRSNRPTCKTPR